MSELLRLSKLFADLQEGNCWIGVNFQSSLQDIPATIAGRTVQQDTNSIWQLVAHIVYWRTTVINRLNGTLDLPSFPDFQQPGVINESNWQELLADFDTCYKQLQHTLMHFDEHSLQRASPRPDQTYFQLITGCLQHDAYHLGQIVLLKKLAI